MECKNDKVLDHGCLSVYTEEKYPEIAAFPAIFRFQKER